MLQAWFQLLDMGLTPTMARETARYNGGASDAHMLRRLLRSLEGIFFGTAIVGALVLIATSEKIAHGWLQVQALPLHEVRFSIILMAVIVALRWVCGLYRGAVNGFERLLWLGSFNMATATARFVLIVPLFLYFGAKPSTFFSYQLVVAVIELSVLVLKTYSLLPKVGKDDVAEWQWAPLRDVIKFSLSIAFTSSIWVLVTQTDKLVLSKLLPLSDYAYFTLAVLVASGVMMVSGPISGALLPRLTNLSARGNDRELLELYRKATQMVNIIAMPAALVLACFAEQVLWSWTGNADIANRAAPVLMLYAVGNGIMALAAFPYYLQFAKGDLKLHLIGNALFVALLIPGLIWATSRFGAIGAGYVWLTANVAYFLCWVPKIHRRFSAGLHSRWLVEDIGIPACIAAAAVLLARHFIQWPQGRWQVALGLAAVGLYTLVMAAMGSSAVRQILRSTWRLRLASQLK
jgi:O-antigen/teichoic acid export membrane protein